MFVDETIEVSVGPSNVTHYRNLGYEAKIGSRLVVSPKDLPKSSDVKVKVRCVRCEAERLVKFSQASEICRQCAMTINGFPAGEDHPDWKGGDERFKCEICGKPTARGKFYKRCKDCFGKDTSGPNHYRWRTDRENLIVRNGNMQRWAQKVKAAAGCVCDACGTSAGENAVAHHLEGISIDRESMYQEENGVCLCSPCHKVFHREFGYGANTAEQYLTFKEANHAAC